VRRNARIVAIVSPGAVGRDGLRGEWWDKMLKTGCIVS
jgi:hypothetical protein